MVRARRFLGSRARRTRAFCARARRNRPRWAPGHAEGGFALLEVVIAFTVLFLALTGIGVEMATQYSSVGSSRNEQAGQAILTRILDEARALPYTVVAKGMSDNDTTATSTSTYIKKIGPGTSIWILKNATLGSGNGTGEVINHYAPPAGLTPPPPFFPHKSCFATSGALVTCGGSGALFTALTFSTKYHSKVVTAVTKTWVSHVIRMTVIVTWHATNSAGNNGSPTTVTGQTLIFAKTVACTSLGVLTTPNPAACQPNFTATALSGNGVIALKPASGSTAIKGLAFTSFDLVLPGTTSNETLTQTSTVLGTAKASGGALAPTSTKNQETLVITKATNDLAAGTSDDQSLTLTQSAKTLTDTSSTLGYSVTATPSATDAGTSLSTTSATTAHGCKNFTGTILTTALPCGTGRAAQGTTTSLSATFGPAGTATLVSAAATVTHSDRVAIARYASGGVVTCPATAKSGCINAGARGALGTVKLAGLPAGLTAPAGWLGYLVKLSGFRARLTTWARSGGTYLTGKTSTVTGTLSYYNGSGYTTLTIKTSSQSVPSSAVTVTTGTTTVKITPHLVLGAPTCTTTTTSSHPSQPHLEQCSISPLSGTITYVVTQSAIQTADFTMTVGLGAFSATASYQVAT